MKNNEIHDKTCGKCLFNDDLLCDIHGELVTDDDTCEKWKWDYRKERVQKEKEIVVKSTRNEYNLDRT